ncbi:MAG: WD40 repeat domain-containing protein, partial [Armatimonadetes bacterium]|nr:WD40 repeat domain-containing protein [Armatimonadota bacterium]
MMRYAPLILLIPLILTSGCLRPAETPPPDTAPPVEVVPPIESSTPAPDLSLAVGHVDCEDDYSIYQPEAGLTRKLFKDVTSPVICSEDGHKLLYQSSTGGIHLGDITSGEDIKIATTIPGSVTALAVSPDGSAVAWVEDGKVNVWRDGKTVALDGPAHPGIPSWSPDGSLLAFGACRGEDASRDNGLWIWDGADVKQLIPPAPGWGSVGRIQWSPDGEWLAWERGAGDEWTGDLARSDGSDLRRDEIAAGPRRWLPDSSGLIVDVHVEAGAFCAGLYRLADRKIVALGPQDADTISCLSPDGSEVMVFGPMREARLIELDAPEVAARWDTPGVVES